MTRNGLYRILGGSCIAGYLWLFVIAGHGTFEVCFFKNITHLPCPSCGSTRSLFSLLNGNFSEALFLNPLGAILFLILTVSPGWIVLDLLLKKDSLFNFYKRFELLTTKKHIAIPGILMVSANWIWNIYKNI